MTLLKVRALSKSFETGKKAVDNVSFSVAENEIICLLGPSGCGKTTLLRCIAGLEIPELGEVSFDGQVMSAIAPHKRDFGMMFQDFALFPHKNVFDNIAFGLQMHHESPINIQKRVSEMLDLVDLVDFAQREIEQLSGGEQQRVALARALAPQPRLLMLDEPLGALDRALRERLMLDLRTILKQVGVTAIYVTHDQTEAFAVADRVAVMNQGQIEQIDPPQIVFHQPATPFIASFLGFENLLPGEVISNPIVRTAIGDLKISDPISETGKWVTLLIRSEAVRFMLSQQREEENVILGKLKTLSFRGKYYQAWMEIVDQVLMFELAQVDLEPGDSTFIKIEPSALMVFPGLAH